jgi:aspartyl-tRNA synthetase
MFALPQSPQQFKQLLMVSGFERYYQIAKCFRDEDLRADRQPEFTQVDIEMSFAGPEFLYSVMEELMVRVFALRGHDVPRPFRRMPWAEAMGKYGSDKPDLRIPLTLLDGSDALRKLGSPIVDGVLADGGRFIGVVLDDGASFSRKKLDELNQKVQEWGGKGLLWVRSAEGGFKASLKCDDTGLKACAESLGLKPGAIAFFVGGKGLPNQEMAGRLRLHLGKDMADPKALNFCWVTDFPLFFHNAEEDRLDSNHHPFTAPLDEDLPMLETEPLKVRSVAYDLVLNGTEVGGGSQRIHTLDLQRRVFQLLRLRDEEIDDKFGFFLDAFRYGAPPHLGIALGLDRLVMLLCGLDSIRDVIPFPKTSSSLCLMSGSPSTVSRAQLDELGIAIKE